MRSGYKRKRKGKGFSETQNQAVKSAKIATVEGEVSSVATNTSQPNPLPEESDADPEMPIGFSRRKMEHDTESSDSLDNDSNGGGYRLINLENLSTILSHVHVCRKGELACLISTLHCISDCRDIFWTCFSEINVLFLFYIKTKSAKICWFC